MSSYLTSYLEHLVLEVVFFLQTKFGFLTRQLYFLHTLHRKFTRLTLTTTIKIDNLKGEGKRKRAKIRILKMYEICFLVVVEQFLIISTFY